MCVCLWCTRLDTKTKMQISSLVFCLPDKYLQIFVYVFVPLFVVGIDFWFCSMVILVSGLTGEEKNIYQGFEIYSCKNIRSDVTWVFFVHRRQSCRWKVWIKVLVGFGQEGLLMLEIKRRNTRRLIFNEMCGWRIL